MQSLEDDVNDMLARGNRQQEQYDLVKKTFLPCEKPDAHNGIDWQPILEREVMQMKNMYNHPSAIQGYPLLGKIPKGYARLPTIQEYSSLFLAHLARTLTREQERIIDDMSANIGPNTHPSIPTGGTPEWTDHAIHRSSHTLTFYLHPQNIMFTPHRGDDDSSSIYSRAQGFHSSKERVFPTPLKQASQYTGLLAALHRYFENQVDIKDLPDELVVYLFTKSKSELPQMILTSKFIMPPLDSFGMLSVQYCPLKNQFNIATDTHAAIRGVSLRPDSDSVSTLRVL